MTRIFDALKKADASRHPAPALAATAPAISARGPEVPRFCVPLVGAIPMGEDVVREMAALRVNLESALRDRMPRIVMFLGPQGGEGSSTIAVQFAQSLARDPALRPLLVDCNVRRPAYVPDEAGRAAMLDRRLIPGSADHGSVVTSNLFVVPLSPQVRAGGLIQPAVLRQLLEANAPGFDWIVLDGPPVLEAPEAAALGAIADGVVVVVQSGRTKRPVLARAAELLGKAGSRVIGSVLNRRVHEIPEFIYRRI